MVKAITTLLFICGLVAPMVTLVVAPAQAASKLLSAGEIRSQLIGKKLHFSGDFDGEIVYRKNGRLNYTIKGKRYKGRWEFKGNRMCTVLFNFSRGGRKTCFTWSSTGKNRYKTSLGYKVRRL